AKADLAHDVLADAPLELRRQRDVAESAEVGQRLAEGARRDERRHQQERGHETHAAMISPAMAASVKKLTHFDARGAVHMVDVGTKPSSHRVAVASGRILMQAATLRVIAAGTAKKGDVLGVARLAAIQAAKRTAGLIPLAHPLALSRVAVDFEATRRPAAVKLKVRVECPVSGNATRTKDLAVEVPQIAENGAVVPVEISSAIPGTTALIVVIDKNPFPLISRFDFKEGALPFVKVNVKMGETSDIRVLAEAGGKHYVATKEVKVTIGGCGG